MIERAIFERAARSLVGCPVRHMGRDRVSGLDCVGVPYAAAVESGLDLPPTLTYGPDPTPEQATQGLSEFCDLVNDIEQAHIWQVCLAGNLRHVVVPVGKLEERTLCVHAWARRSRVLQTSWRSAEAIGWRIRGIEWQRH